MRRPEIIGNDCSYNTKVFYIRSSDENVQLGEIVNFKSEFEAAFPASKKEVGGGLFSQKFYLEVSLYFKEATSKEIESIENLKSHI